MNPRRALLFMPGDDWHKIEKGAALEVDLVIMDLEDAVALSHKQQARETVAAALQDLDFGQSERLVRINPVIVGGLYPERSAGHCAFSSRWLCAAEDRFCSTACRCRRAFK